ncbi:MAG: carboxypeptidase regulatory-like domain-containing protein, partial [Bacteroidales bacterium]|nr:carboxypeptidase regulatory-like domain-containing protein [Bacteroidales bacterium]
NSEEGEPRFLYTSSMHGDELTGFILMMHLIDHLLENYGQDTRITDMINNTEIWINPLANPDGAYYSGNHTVSGAIRFNINNVDLNRNYPDPEDGPHPDGKSWQKETLEYMELADSVSVVMEANLHSGAEVCNYPWDTWYQRHADDDWWQYVCREYADTVHAFAPSGYLDDLNNGITNGYDWYSIAGGRQDYMNYFHDCREFILELSNIHLPPESSLPSYWEYNYRSLINYIEQIRFGITGTVTDSVSGEPVRALVRIPGHDADSSEVYSDINSGKYFRPLFEGNYNIAFEAPGYKTKIVNGIQINNRTLQTLNVQLVQGNNGLNNNNFKDLFIIGPNPVVGELVIRYSGKEKLLTQIRLVNNQGEIVYKDGYTVIETNDIKILSVENLSTGIYFLIIETPTTSFVEKTVIL